MRMRKVMRIFAFFSLAIATLTLLYLYTPIILLYLTQPTLKTSFNENDFYITINKISAQAKINPNVDPWNEIEYSKALQTGVAQAKGFSTPGETGITYLFAHSSSNPLSMTRINTPFLRLFELQTGDDIQIVKSGQIYSYQVIGKKEVLPSRVEAIINTSSDLVLQTCSPLGTSLYRLLIFAKLDYIRPLNES